jgi:predicted phosphate transport protein (TIGR00153 family)
LSTARILSWFEKRRKNKTLKEAMQQITKSIETIKDLKSAVAAFYEGRDKDVEKHLAELFVKENEIDDLRRSVLEKLSEGSLPMKYREDLMLLVRRLDMMADRVKDSGRSLKILRARNIPKELKKAYVDTTEDLFNCSVALGSCLEMLGTDTSKVPEYAKKVQDLETKLDERYLQSKSLLFKYEERMGCATIIELKDLTEFLEQTADLCEDTSDYIRTLAAGERS